MPKSIIITCAVTGAIHTPTMSKYLPITPKEIRDEAVAAAAAGASIIHLHARDPQDGKPTADADIYMEFLPAIQESTDAILNITTGGGHGMTLAQRCAGALRATPEMVSLNMGSMNFGLFPMLNKQRKWKYEWEPAYLNMTRDFIFRNTYEDIEWVMKKIGEDCGSRFEFECYDVSHLYNLAHFIDRGLVKPPFLIQTIFGVLGGIGADIENLMHMRRISNKLFGEQNYEWSILAAGRHQFSFATSGAILGGNVRVGLEDSLYLSKGRLAKSNADQVKKIKRVLEDLSLDIATPTETRKRLQLKGIQQVGF
jgi:uncharacterized protein (DUF849 family)